MKYLNGLFLLLVLCAFAESIDACSCSGSPSACESHQSSDGVFVGYVERTTGKNTLGSFNTGYVSVEQVFKGKVPKNVKFHWGYTSCDVFLEPGSRWLFYARKVDKKGEVWDIGACGGSHELKRNSIDGDLKYLNNLRENIGKTRLSGTYSYRSGASISRATIEMQEVAGRKYELMTDENGFFELYGLPIGTYYLKPKLPEGARFRGAYLSGDWRIPPFPKIEAPAGYDESNSAKVEIGRKQCVEASISVETGNSIGGRVVNYQGKPLTGLCVSLLNAEKTVSGESESTDCVNDNGDFLIYGFPRGRYVLGLLRKDGDSVNYDRKFPSVFYPGTLKKETGQIFEIGNDDQFGDIEIKLPKNHPLKLIEGVLLYSNGEPTGPKGIAFTYWEGKQRKIIEQRTDEKGKFALPLPAGTKGFLKGRAQIFSYDTENCPQLRKYVSEEAIWEYADTKPIWLQVKTNMADLKLRLPFTPCSKDEDEAN